jgi:competence protein ComEA
MIEVSEFRAKAGVTAQPRIDLNTATADELRALPRVGPALANRIVATRRKTRGGFKTLDDVAAVDGIGADTLRIIEPFVTLSHK